MSRGIPSGFACGIAAGSAGLDPALLLDGTCGARVGDVAARVYRDPRQRRRPATLQPLSIPKQPQTAAFRTDSRLTSLSSAEYAHPGDMMVMDSDTADWTPPMILSHTNTPVLSSPLKSVELTDAQNPNFNHTSPSILSVSSTFVDTASIHSTATNTTATTSFSWQSAAAAHADVYGWEEELHRKLDADISRRASAGSDLHNKTGHPEVKVKKSLLQRVLNAKSPVLSIKH